MHTTGDMFMNSTRYLPSSAPKHRSVAFPQCTLILCPGPPQLPFKNIQDHLRIILVLNRVFCPDRAHSKGLRSVRAACQHPCCGNAVQSALPLAMYLQPVFAAAPPGPMGRHPLAIEALHTRFYLPLAHTAKAQLRQQVRKIIHKMVRTHRKQHSTARRNNITTPWGHRLLYVRTPAFGVVRR